MKTILLSITLAFVAIFAGCATTGPQSGRLQSAVYVAAYVGTSEALRAHPEWRLGFELAARELKVLEDGNIDAIKLMEIVKRLPVKELKSDRASLIITSATILLSDQIGTTPIEKLENLKPVVASIRQGIERGLESQ